MKKLFILLAFTPFFFSCSKSVDSIQPPNNDQPEISFDITGTHFAHIGYQTAENSGIGVFATKAPGFSGVTYPFYSFAGFTDNTNLIQIIINTPNDTLKTITYHANQSGSVGATIRANNYIYTCMDASDFIDVTVTSYQNGVVNARFSGNVTKIISATVTQKVTITNGVIKNVRLRY